MLQLVNVQLTMLMMEAVKIVFSKVVIISVPLVLEVLKIFQSVQLAKEITEKVLVIQINVVVWIDTGIMEPISIVDLVNKDVLPVFQVLKTAKDVGETTEIPQHQLVLV